MFYLVNGLSPYIPQWTTRLIGLSLDFALVLKRYILVA